MTETKSYFFCGIGGSGMLPLAMIVAARGAQVSGSDRSRDQGRSPEKFAWLERQGATLFAQDGSGKFTVDVSKLSPTGEVLGRRTLTADQLYLDVDSALEAEGWTKVCAADGDGAHGWRAALAANAR